MKKVSDLKVTFLGVTPEYKREKNYIPSQEIVSFSAWSSFKGKPFQKLLRELKRKNQDPSKKTEVILKNSSLKGHSSIATTPVFSFSYEGTKFLDSALTGMTFASALMASGRRTSTSEKDIIFPDSFLNKIKIRNLYYEESRKNIEFFNYLLSENIPKDEASKILQYGIYGTGIIQFPIESVVSLKREWEIERKWMPKEIEILLEKMERYFKKSGVNLIYASRIAAPRNAYFYPNIFKDPQKNNLARIFGEDISPKNLFKIVNFSLNIPKELENDLRLLKKEIKRVISQKKIKKEWKRLIDIRREIIRDYNLAVRFDIASRVSWRVWGEKKRHRTVPMIADSIYYSVEKTEKVLKKYKGKVERENLREKELEEINLFLDIPQLIKKREKILYSYLKRAISLLETYSELIKEGAEFRDALFIVPRAVKVNVLQSYDLYNLIAGYYPLRLCSTVEEELRMMTIREVAKIKEILKKKGYNSLAECINPKCYAIGFCPERYHCKVIKTRVPYYDGNFHKMMQEDLNKNFQRLK